MHRKLVIPLLGLILSLAGCSRAVRPDRRATLSPAEKLRIATQSGQNLEATEMAKEAAEFSEWQKKRAAGQARPFDEPDGAQAFFVLKRLAQGETAVDGSQLIAAATAARAMGVYSTARRASVTPARPGGRDLMLADGQNIPGTWTPLGPGNVGGRTREFSSTLRFQPPSGRVAWRAASGRPPTEGPPGLQKPTSWSTSLSTH
jgi:hypothetical protein